MIKVLAIVKNDIYINCIKNYLKQDQIEFLQVCKDPLYTLDLINNLKPDVVLIDLNWDFHTTGTTSTDLVEKIRSSSISPKIVVLSIAFGKTDASHVNKLGVNGWFSRTADNAINELAYCIKRVHSGSMYNLHLEAS